MNCINHALGGVIIPVAIKYVRGGGGGHKSCLGEVLIQVCHHLYSTLWYRRPIEGIAVALAQTRLRFNRPYISFSRIDFGRHMEVESLEATADLCNNKKQYT